MIAFGGLLTAIGLIMALAVADRLDGVDLVVAGWIVAAVGVVLLVAGLFTASSARRTEHRVVEDRHISTD
jgi:energy-converting hydrogenase Eha subunit C